MTLHFNALADLLFPQQVYAELKQLARQQLARQPARASLNTTAPAHEAASSLHRFSLPIPTNAPTG